MASKTIAILGANGKMGTAIARSIAGGPYRLLLFARESGKAEALADAIRKDHPGADASAIACPFDASWEADIIIPAVPYAAQQETAEHIKQVATQKIVISIANPLNATRDGLLTAPGTSAAEELQAALPHAKVVKAFSTSFDNTYANNTIDGKADNFIAGDDEEAVETVARLVADAGFNPVIAGGLTASRTLEAMTLLLLQLSTRYGLNRQAAWKLLTKQ